MNYYYSLGVRKSTFVMQQWDMACISVTRMLNYIQRIFGGNYTAGTVLCKAYNYEYRRYHYSPKPQVVIS